jgi:hypothetical protein
MFGLYPLICGAEGVDGEIGVHEANDTGWERMVAHLPLPCLKDISWMMGF